MSHNRSSHVKDNHMEISTRIAVLENSIAHIHETMKRIETNMNANFHRLDAKIDRLDAKIDAGFKHLDAKIDAGFKHLGAKIDCLGSKVDSNFKWLLTLYIGSFLGLLGILAKGFHWL